MQENSWRIVGRRCGTRRWSVFFCEFRATRPLCAKLFAFTRHAACACSIAIRCVFLQCPTRPAKSGRRRVRTTLRLTGSPGRGQVHVFGRRFHRIRRLFAEKWTSPQRSANYARFSRFVFARGGSGVSAYSPEMSDFSKTPLVDFSGFLGSFQTGGKVRHRFLAEFGGFWAEFFPVGYDCPPRNLPFIATESEWRRAGEYQRSAQSRS